VGKDDWFRNSTWNPSIERAFEEKLSRARRKEQYIRIQACCLTKSHPEVALSLLDRFFAMPDQWDQAQAHVDRASALSALGRYDEAAAAYERALKREAEFPRLLTGAYIEFPTLVAERKLRQYYDRGLEVLRDYQKRVTFPSDRFKWHAASALILSEVGQDAAARENARFALEAALITNSGFRYHQEVGLVTSAHSPLIARLKGLCDA
jgi:tetratricopeptide (TPR) repeat protein